LWRPKWGRFEALIGPKPPEGKKRKKKKRKREKEKDIWVGLVDSLCLLSFVWSLCLSVSLSVIV
jgi:hypothetical protein